MDSTSDFANNIRLGYSLGWSFTPLTGKRPILDGWQSRERETLAEALEWATQGNVGLRTGYNSGVFVIDVDVEKGADPALIAFLPKTVMVGRGENRHLYFKMPAEDLGNSVGKLDEHVDTRGNGGQVVYPGSTHPDTGMLYQWIEGYHPSDTPLAELPQWVVRSLSTPKRKPVVVTNVNRYVHNALSVEVREVSSASEGSRNDTLNKAAYSLGQLVGANCIGEELVRSQLLAAAASAGLSETEALNTIDSGLAAGIREPREPVLAATRSVPYPKIGDDSGDQPAVEDFVLAPGSHIKPNGEYVEVGNDDFAAEVLSRFHHAEILRRDKIVGVLDGPPGKRKFSPMNENDMRLVIDSRMRIVSMAMKKDGPAASFKTCTKDWAGLVLALAAKSAPPLDMLVNYPVYGPTWTRMEPGYTNGIYYDEPEDLENLVPEMDAGAITATLEELTVDFPFDSIASQANFNGLLLTPLVRPALQGNTPFHVVISSLERTGKSKLAEDVFGGIILGRSTPAMQITERDEERDKRILSLLILGETAIHLDNLPQFIDSPSLASLLTAKVYQGRLLGSNQTLTLPNNLTVIGSGNNTQASPELVKRVVPIVLQPHTSSPETRVQFKHPDLGAYIKSMRRRVMECLIGAVEIWIASGFPRCKERMGGFESWSEVLGSIMRTLGYVDWRSNVRDWRKNSDPRSEELDSFVDGWWDEYQTIPVSAKQLAGLARSMGVFRDSYTDHGRMISMGRRLGPLVNRPVGDLVIRCTASGASRRYYLERPTD